MTAKFLLLLTISFVKNCVTIDNNGTHAVTGINMMTLLDRKSRSNYVSFEPLGENIQLGLDFLLPFLKIPFIRKADAYGNEPALININTAALLSTGLLASSSALISLLFRKYMLLGREQSSSEKRRRSNNLLEKELWSAFDNFKLVYTNSSGVKVDTSLADWFDTINEFFEKNDIDLISCIQKAICIRIQMSAISANEQDSSGVNKIIDGLISIKWINEFLRHTSLKAAIEARYNLALPNQQQNQQFCDIRYSQCKWSMPEEYLINIMRTYLKFT